MYYVYMLRCRGGRYYTGITPDLSRRMQAHCAGKGAKFTRAYPPEALCAVWRCADKIAAAKAEYAIKAHLTHAEKARLIDAPESLTARLPQLEALGYTAVGGLTLEVCLDASGEHPML